MTAAGLLIVNAEVEGASGVDVRCRDGKVVELGTGIAPNQGEQVLDAGGGALLPGLHDHHIHLLALAAAARSIRCGPPAVTDPAALREAVRQAPGNGWIRGVGYHESVAGMLDRPALDRLETERPLRIQHRSGKMWFFNSAALRALGIESPNGQLFRGDRLLRERLPASDDPRIGLAAVSTQLASYGVTGVTDATPTNNPNTVALYRSVPLRQRLQAMGDESLATGPLKILLDDAELPELDALGERMASAHRRDRPVAVHCVTRTELIFALAAFGDAGTRPGDRIEHAAVADDEALALLRRTRGGRDHLTVVTQPNFIAERGDAYRRDVPASDQDFLYRGRGFLDADISLGGGTDAPFGHPDPWRAMRAAVDRRAPDGSQLGPQEALSPEQALALFTTPLEAPGGEPRGVTVGAAADLCLMNAPWRTIRCRLAAKDVAATIIGGQLQDVPGGRGESRVRDARREGTGATVC